MNCGCSPKYITNMFKEVTEQLKKGIKQKICTFFLNLQKKKKEYIDLSAINEADKIFYNGTIYTMESENSTADAVAVYKDKILFVGSFYQANLLKGQKTQLINLKGKTLLPGFIDSHLHLELEALKGFTDLSHFIFNSQLEVSNKVIETVSQTKGEWALFQLYDPIITQGIMPHSKEDLDLISKDKAIFIFEANGHIAHCNSKAFELAGIDQNGEITPNPPQGKLVRNKKSQLTGQIQESAIFEMAKFFPKISYQQYRNNVLELIDRISSKGITTVHDCGIGNISPQYQLQFISCQFGPQNKIRLAGMLIAPLWDKWMELNIKPEYNDPEVRINGIKCVSDGSTQGGSAYLTKPYLKKEWGVGQPNYTQEQLDQIVMKAHKNNFRVGIHSNGDAAIDMALNSFQKARQLKINHSLRLRAQHSTLCREDQLQRMYELGVSPGFLIGHVYFYGIPFRDEILGIERARRIDPVKSAYKHNLKPALHSDYNCQPVQPLRYIHNAVTRVLKYSKNNQVLGAQERISVFEGVKAVTSNAAWQCHMDDIVGSITVGKLADFVILEQDPFKINPLDIINIQISQTWKGGKLRFEDKPIQKKQI